MKHPTFSLRARLSWLNLALILILAAGCRRQTLRDSEPLSPEQALKSFQVEGDFSVQIFAAEPHVTDPVELVFDEMGRAFVAEMLDLPDDPPSGQAPRSRIRLLEDTDGDGRIDRSLIFADKLLQVTSLLPWKGGLLVTAAPEILYLKDTDGDNVADLRKVVFSGFAVVNPESRITNLRYNIDNWIYASNNGREGDIRFLERPDASPVSVLGADFRFRLDRGWFEAESGPTQFGQALNDWGDRFITENTVHVRHVVVPRRYLARNPYFVPGRAAQDISDHGQPSAPLFPRSKPQQWRIARTEMRQRRYRENELDKVRDLNPASEMAGGYFSAAAGGTIYSGDLFPTEYYGNLFTGDVSANLVHRDLLRANGASYLAGRGPHEQDREFLTSTDPWFRPCNFANGPDGALYVVDIYREFIETPESVPEELKKSMDFYSGTNLGRIYRVAPKNSNAKPLMPRLDRASPSELVRYLEHRSGWYRITAQRLLVERQLRETVPALRQMVHTGLTPQSRLHALYALEGLNGLDTGLLQDVLKDGHAELRVHAIRLAEPFLEMASPLAALINDPSPRVQFQLSFSLGQFSGPEITRALSRLAAQNIEDPWCRTAVLSSEAGSSPEMFAALLKQDKLFKTAQEGGLRFLEDYAAVVSARNRPGELDRFLSWMLSHPQLQSERLQIAGLTGLSRGLKIASVVRMRSAAGEKLISRSLTGNSQALNQAARPLVRHFELRSFLRQAEQLALDTRQPAARREVAIVALAGAPFQQTRKTFEAILRQNPEASLAKATLETFSTYDDPEVGEVLLGPWKSYGPVMRGQVLDALLSRREHFPTVLAALESGRIEKASVDLARREKLLSAPDPQWRQRASRLFTGETSDRARVVQAYSPALQLAGNPNQGKALFEKHCAACHWPRQGGRVGPDLSGVSSNTREQLLQSILDPSSAIEPRYTNYIVLTSDGRIHDGIIVSETPGTLSLRNQDIDQTILRRHITEIRASQVSLMPEGLEEGIDPKGMADLLAYLQAAQTSSK
ncbi:MAG: PVC-type heme-binding CxxCH protein [Acidobacteriota bacterium]